MLTSNEVLNTCRTYSGKDYYVGQAILPKHLKNARSIFPIPSDEEIHAFINSTVFNSGKEGLAIGAHGIYWRSISSSKQNKLTWEEFINVEVRIEKNDLILGASNAFNMSGSFFSKDILLTLLLELQSKTKEQFIRQKRWMLAIDGSQSGPYTTDDINQLIIESKIDPYLSYVWSEGMSEWVLAHQKQEFSSFLKGKSVPPPLPPRIQADGTVKPPILHNIEPTKSKEEVEKPFSQIAITVNKAELQTSNLRDNLSAKKNDSEVKNFINLTSYIQEKGLLGIKPKAIKTFSWFLLVNAAVAISIIIISGGELLRVIPYFLICGSVFPLINLMFSTTFAKKVHRMTVIREGNFLNSSEEGLYSLVQTLSKRAGLERTPQVAIYESEDYNAFATGMNKKRSLIAFSTSLLSNVNERSIAAVAAHEISHIANGDMLTMTLTQSVINAIVLMVTIPFSLLKSASLFFRRCR